MVMFSVRVANDVAQRFDAAAADTGGRSATLRRLIGTVAAPTHVVPSGPRTAARLMVRLTAPDAAGVDAEAAAMGLRRAAWVAALVRRRVRGRPTFSRSDELMLIAIQTELRRIGVNINQIARALNTSVTEGKVLDLELAYLDDLRAEIRGHLSALHEAFEGNLAYWEIEP
ncbi:plasmid mobilization relaxosome protein MobC [Brevundimonas diminuta]|uniref:plasmid mobilization relaxosome protein MobC n=1 Tax=Brevundimonas TaxID=41275 RepID=UPI001904FCAA|nr:MULTISPECIES: plasmid mobilization relaxosome protein MobC [Brevundimonas]MBK1976276.1 plasmid mobilization relaxosome protein MobC [Brevundimonas diminuta]